MAELDINIIVLALFASFTFFGAIVLYRLRNYESRWIGSIPYGLIFFVMMISSAQLYFLSQTSFQPQEFFVNWIKGFENSVRFRIGILLDGYQTTMSIFCSFFAVAALVFTRGQEEEPQFIPMRAGVLMGLSGVVLAWSAATLWFAFFGMAIVFLGGTLVLGVSHYGVEGVSRFRILTRYFWQSFSFLGGAFIGAAVLSDYGIPLDLSGAVETTNSGQGFAGAVILVFSILFMLKPTPFHWRLSFNQTHPKRGHFFSMVLTVLIFPLWVAEAVLFRFGDYFRDVGVSVWADWGATGVALVVALIGLFQQDQRRVVLFAITSFSFLTFGGTLSSGPHVGFPLLIGGTCGVLGLAAVCDVLSLDGEESSLERRKEGLNFFPVLFGMILVGFFGSAVYAGYCRWVGLSGAPMSGAIRLGILTAISFFYWKCAWALFSQTRRLVLERLENTVLALLALLGMSVWWTGSVSGATSEEFKFSVMASFSDLLLQGSIGSERAQAWLQYDSGHGYEWILAGAFLVMGVAGFLMITVWGSVHLALGRAAPVIEDFFYMDSFLWKVFYYLVIGARWWDVFVSEKIWRLGLLRFFGYSLIVAGLGFQWVDKTVREDLPLAVFDVAQTPTRALRVIQNGSVQWYLFFSLVLGFSIILHFLIH